jgi:glycosyltransferase involved in cell wall biosynthesis
VRYHLAWLTVLRNLRRSRPDVVQFAGARFPVDGLLWAWLARRRGRRAALLTVAHAPVPFNEQRASGAIFKRNRLLDRSLALGYRSLDAVLVLGEQTAADLRAAWPGVREVAVVPHGNEGVFLREAPIPASCTDPVVLFFGTMQAYKGLDLLLEAFALVRVDQPDARLIVAGAPSGDTDLADLRRTAERVGGVDLRPGYVPLEEVPQLFEQARVVATPYRYANASGVVELAHTFARPVVATAVGDLPVVVEHGKGGVVVPPGDIEALAAALVQLLRSPEDAQRLGDGGHARSVDRASWPGVAERVEAVYRQCLRSRAQVSRGPGWGA